MSRALQLLLSTAMAEPSHCKSRFDNLPNQLIQRIYKLSSINTKLCLKMTCKTLRNKSPGTARELYKDLNIIIDFGNARFERLC